MSLRPAPRLFVQPLDVGVELLAVDPPDAAPADLDRGEVAGANERVHLGDAHVEVGRHVLERQEPCLDAAFTSLALFGHLRKVPPLADRCLALPAFASVWLQRIR